MRIASMAAPFLAAVTAMPAQAQDGSFTGVHVEGVVGWDNFSNGSTGIREDSTDGVVWGGAIGYDYDTGGLVLGAEAEFTGSSASASSGAVIVPTDNFRIEADRDIYVGLRAGYAFTPQFLAYAKGGYTNARVETTYEPGVPGAVITEDSANSDGFRVGAGLEYRTPGGFFGRLEYRYSHYGDIDGYDIDMDRSQVVAGLGFRF